MEEKEMKLEVPTSPTGSETPSGSNEASITEVASSNTGHGDEVRRIRSTTKYKSPTGRMPRQWIIDRCDGKSQYNPDSRPPCRICYVPLPVKWWPDMLEQNCMCECMGRTGCIDPENAPVRRNLFRTAFIINVIGLCCLIVSMFSATTDHFNVIWRLEYSRIWLQLISGPDTATDVPVLWAIGLRAIAYDNEITNQTRIEPFGSVCAMIQQAEGQDPQRADAPDTQQEQPKLNSRMDPTLHMVTSQPEFHCNECEEISRRIVPSLFLSMLSYIPNFTTDILRMYSNYDVNCQKFLASTFSWISLATAIYTWVNYRRGCFDSLGTIPFAINENFERVEMDSDDAYLIVNFQYRAGIGQICLAVATFLKVIDIAFNIILPTPTITRDFLEQVEYEWKYGQHSDDEEEQAHSMLGNGDDNGEEEENIPNQNVRHSLQIDSSEDVECCSIHQGGSIH